MKNINFWAAVAVAAGLLAGGAMMPLAVKVNRSGDRTVSVKGLCEREVSADKVIWPIKYKSVGNDLQAVYASIEKGNSVITAFLREGGVSDAEISVSIPTINDKFAQEYGSNDRTYRYVASSTVTVCSSDVDKILALMDSQRSLLKDGIAPENDWDSKPQFSFEGLNDLKPEMIQEATRNAREAAGKFAADSQSRLGKIRTASQGIFSIEDRDSNTPQIKKVRVVTNVVYYLKD